MNQWLYQLQAVTKCYGGAPVLSIDRLEVRPGELLCLIGPTGAGKSTLLRLLSTLETPTSGQLEFAGERLNGQSVPLSTQRRVTMVFQRPLLLRGTVRANVEYGLRLRAKLWRVPGFRGRANERAGADTAGPRKHATPWTVFQVLERLGLSALAERSAQTLSGGETQLVALARAVVLEPEVILLDEPTANLDPARVARVEELITAVQRQQKTTVIWATHNIFQARRMAQRVALLLDGRLVEIAPVKDFFEAPRDPRAAAFVRGEMVY